MNWKLKMKCVSCGNFSLESYGTGCLGQLGANSMNWCYSKKDFCHPQNIACEDFRCKPLRRKPWYVK